MLIRITGGAYESRFNGGRERRERNYFYPEFESKNGISLQKMSENWSDREWKRWSLSVTRPASRLSSFGPSSWLSFLWNSIRGARWKSSSYVVSWEGKMLYTRWYLNEGCCWYCESEEWRRLLFFLLSNSLPQPITLITASMGVHPFYHKEIGHSDDDHDGRYEYDSEDGLALLHITLITISIRFHPFHGEKRKMRRISGLSTLVIVVSVVVNIIVVPIRMMAWPRLYGRQGGDQPDIGPFIALLLAFLLFCFLLLMTLAKKKMQLLNAVTAHKIGSFFFLCLLSFTFLNVLDSVGNTLLASWTSLMTVSAHLMHLLANLSLHPFYLLAVPNDEREECLLESDAKLSSSLEIILVNLGLYLPPLLVFFFFRILC